MITSVQYDILVYDFYNDKISYEDTFDLNVNVDFEEMRDYLFFKKYNKPFSATSWYLEDNAREFIKELEERYFYNKLEIDDVEDFKNYIKEKYKLYVENKVERDDKYKTIIQELYQEINDEQVELFDITLGCNVIEEA